MKFTRIILPLAVAATLLASGCRSTASNQKQQADSMNAVQAPGTVAQGPPPPNSTLPPDAITTPGPSAYIIPASTRISVRMAQTISSKTATEGEPFSGTVVRPVVVDGKPVIQAGASASGTVVATKSRGRFKGEG
jgi:hypothetical protein